MVVTSKIFAPFNRLDGVLDIRPEDGKLIWKRGNGDVPLTKAEVVGLYPFFPKPSDAKSFIEKNFDDDGIYSPFKELQNA